MSQLPGRKQSQHWGASAHKDAEDEPTSSASHSDRLMTKACPCGGSSRWGSPGCRGHPASYWEPTKMQWVKGGGGGLIGHILLMQLERKSYYVWLITRKKDTSLWHPPPTHPKKPPTTTMLQVYLLITTITWASIFSTVPQHRNGTWYPQASPRQGYSPPPGTPLCASLPLHCCSKA